MDENHGKTQAADDGTSLVATLLDIHADAALDGTQAAPLCGCCGF